MDYNHNKKGMDSKYWEYRMNSREVYKYWKDRCGLVSGSYAAKVLGVGKDKFRKIRDEHNLQVHEKPAPNHWKAKLYSLQEVRQLKERLEENNGS